MTTLYINRTETAGNLVADPVLKFLPSGDAVCNVTVATNKYIRNKDGEGFKTLTQFHFVAFFRHDAEKLVAQAKKGSNIHFEGSLEHSQYDDKLTGETKYSTKIIGSKLTVISNMSERNSVASEDKSEVPVDPLAAHGEFIDALGPEVTTESF